VRAIRPCALPAGALLERYRRGGHYTDCYVAQTAAAVTGADYVAAFYTTPVFKLERLILKWAVSRPSTDAQARELAGGLRDDFAAWDVEARAPEQLLMRDLYGRTCSWLMAEPSASGGTRLYFGSAVVVAPGRAQPGGAFRPLLGFHKLYSRVLLRAARSRLEARR
jgi:hypothetical protein